MSSSYTPTLMGVVSPVSEILLPSKTAKFPFLTMDYSSWSSKNLIDRNRLKKFMQVGIDVKFMHTNFGGRGLSGFGDLLTKHAVVYEKLNLIELFLGSYSHVHVSPPAPSLPPQATPTSHLRCSLSPLSSSLKVCTLINQKPINQKILSIFLSFIVYIKG